MMPACDKCRSPATLQCGGCSTHQPEQLVSWYCSKPCQKADWSDHKQDCLLARFYSRVRDLTSVRGAREEFDAAVKAHPGLSKEVVHDMRRYLGQVVPAKRAQFAYPENPSQLKELSDFMASKEEYMSYLEDHLPKDTKACWCIEYEWRLAMHDRPVKSITDRKGNERHMIEFFATDFVIIAFVDYRIIFGGGRKAYFDPWVKKEVSGKFKYLENGVLGECLVELGTLE